MGLQRLAQRLKANEEIHEVDVEVHPEEAVQHSRLEDKLRRQGILDDDEWLQGFTVTREHMSKPKVTEIKVKTTRWSPLGGWSW